VKFKKIVTLSDDFSVTGVSESFTKKRLGYCIFVCPMHCIAALDRI